MDETETIPYDIDDSETIVYASPRRRREDEIEEKIYKETKLGTAAETEKQAVEDEKKIESELEQNKVDIQIEKESDIKKVQDIFAEVREEKPINVKNFFIDDNDIFDSEKNCNPDRELIIDLINRTNFIVDTKRFIEELKVPKIETVHPKEKETQRKEQMSIDDDEKGENTSVENTLTNEIKKEFEEEQEKNKKK